MSPEDIKALGRRITEELFNQGDLSVVDEFIDPGYTDYLAAEQQTVSAAELKDFITTVRRALPDLHAHTEQQVVEGDTLVQRLTVTGTHQGPLYDEIAATGKRIRICVVDITRIGPNGTFVQRWTLADHLSLFNQLGLLADLPARRAS
jgi:predicted ester cyclase